VKKGTEGESGVEKLDVGRDDAKEKKRFVAHDPGPRVIRRIPLKFNKLEYI